MVDYPGETDTMVWGINDFDEAWTLPYTNDLIRLATSALLARMECDEKLGVEAIRNGYMECLEAGGRPRVLPIARDDRKALAETCLAFLEVVRGKSR